MASLFQLIPVPAPIQDQSDVRALKKRLDWGEPALTIIDVRSESAFRTSHITGSISMPMDGLVPNACASLESVRDIYVYGETNEATAEAAARLRSEGYEHIAELIGGLIAWKAAKFPIEELSQATA